MGGTRHIIPLIFGLSMKSIDINHPGYLHVWNTPSILGQDTTENVHLSRVPGPCGLVPVDSSCPARKSSSSKGNQGA